MQTLNESQQACEALETAQNVLAGHTALRSVECRMYEGTLLLTGQVPSYYLKQLAQGLIMHRLEGLVSIENGIEVSSG